MRWITMRKIDWTKMVPLGHTVWWYVKQCRLGHYFGALLERGTDSAYLHFAKRELFCHQAVSTNVLNKQIHCLSCGSSKKNDFLDCAECPQEINCSPLSRKWNQNIIIEISSTSVMHFAHYLSNDNCWLLRSFQIDFLFLVPLWKKL